MVIQKISFSVVVLLLVSCIYYVIPINSTLHSRGFAADEKQSTIASIAVEGMNRNEMNEALQEQIRNWTAQKMTIAGAGETISLDASTIQFDISDSIDRYEMLTYKPWYVFWKKKPLAQIPITILLSEEVSRQIAQVPQWNHNETSNNVIAQAAYLKSHEVEAVVSEQAKDISKELLVAVVEPLPEKAFGIQEVLEPFIDYALPSHEEFSFLELLAGQESFANEQALNFVASMLYSVALQSNSEIIERHSQNVIPPYLEPGVEAAVEKNGHKNLRFVNTTNEAIQMQFTVQGESLKLEAYATNLIEPATLRIAREKEITPRVVIRYSNDLAIGRQRVLEPGKNGLRVIVYRSHPETGEERISKDFYAPLNKVVLKSARVPEPEPEEVIPNLSSGVAGESGTGDVNMQTNNGLKNTNLSQQQVVEETITTTSDILSDNAEATANMKKKKLLQK